MLGTGFGYELVQGRLNERKCCGKKKCGARGYGSQPEEDKVDPGTNRKL